MRHAILHTIESVVCPSVLSTDDSSGSSGGPIGRRLGLAGVLELGLAAKWYPRVDYPSIC